MRDEQERRENYVDRHLDDIDAELQNVSQTRVHAEETLARITSLMAQVSTFALELDDSFIESLLRDGLSQIGLDLARRARRLDPTVTIIDILQAARNAWTACGLQLLLGKQMNLTPAIFAYSMLYPYSDNYLDDNSISRASKLRFSERFGRRLKGDHFAPTNEHEATIWKLVGFIESEYPRAGFPKVYDSLLAIHHAQQESIRQLQSWQREEVDIARLTITKGGTSVLADAYLAAGNLSETEAKFAFDWGVVLQLGDDLQDFHADRKRGSMTLFTEASGPEALDKTTNKAFHFSQGTMMQAERLHNCTEVLRKLIARSSQLLLIRSAAGAPAFYTGWYVRELERYSPFRFEFLRSREQRFARGRRMYAKLFEEVVRAAQYSNKQPGERRQIGSAPVTLAYL